MILCSILCNGLRVNNVLFFYVNEKKCHLKGKKSIFSEKNILIFTKKGII